MSYDTSQLVRLADSFAGDVARVRRDMPREVEKAGRRVEARARATVEVDTGELRDSIRTAMRRPSRDAAYADVEAGTDHGWIVEEGTSRQPPEPYLWPAVLAEVPRLAVRVQKVTLR